MTAAAEIGLALSRASDGAAAREHHLQKAVGVIVKYSLWLL